MKSLTSKLSELQGLPLLKKWSPAAAVVPEAEELEKFKSCQRLAYQCCVSIAQEIQVGWTELQTADMMNSYLKDFGVSTFFHKSFAWFGSRTRFQGFSNYLHFMPSKRRLVEGDVVILDTAPIFDGYVADVGHTFSLQENAELVRAQNLLLDFRKELPALFGGPEPAKEIWRHVDEKLKQNGFDNCHAKYPFGVLGHRVHKVPFWQLPGLVAPFSLHSYWSLVSRGLFSELLSDSHTGSKKGLWAVEPHLGGDGFGAKFEEILVVEEEKAYWLDDEVPHNKEYV